MALALRETMLRTVKESNTIFLEELEPDTNEIDPTAVYFVNNSMDKKIAIKRHVCHFEGHAKK